MNILFVHQNMPGQYRELVQCLPEHSARINALVPGSKRIEMPRPDPVRSLRATGPAREADVGQGGA